MRAPSSRSLSPRAARLPPEQTVAPQAAVNDFPGIPQAKRTTALPARGFDIGGGPELLYVRFTKEDTLRFALLLMGKF